MEILFLSSWRPIFCVSTSSIIMEPSISAILNIKLIRELLPAPVRPTSPTYNISVNKDHTSPLVSMQEFLIFIYYSLLYHVDNRIRFALYTGISYI